MPKLESSGNGPWKRGQEILQQGGIRLQIGRKLKKDGSQLAGSGKRFNRHQKSAKELLASLEPLDVRDDLVSLHAKTKVRRGVRQPVLHRGFFHQLPEGEVHFDCIQPGRVMSEEFFLRQLLRVKVGFPTGVCPAGSSCEELRHVESLA